MRLHIELRELRIRRSRKGFDFENQERNIGIKPELAWDKVKLVIELMRNGGMPYAEQDRVRSGECVS